MTSIEELFLRLTALERMNILAKLTNIHHDLMTLEEHYKKEVCPLIIKLLVDSQIVTSEFNAEDIITKLESIGMVFLDDEQELDDAEENSPAYKEGWHDAQENMLEANFKKVLEAGK
jgi:hypothetical protein